MNEFRDQNGMVYVVEGLITKIQVRDIQIFCGLLETGQSVMDGEHIIARIVLPRLYLFI